MAVGLEDAGFQIRDMPAWRFTQRAQFKAFGMDHFVGRMDITEIERERIKKELQGRKTPQLQTEFETMVLAQKPRKGTFVDNWREYRTGLIDSNARLNGRGPKTIMTVEKPQRAQYNGHLTIKPLKLLEYLIRLLSVRGQVVLDPFLVQRHDSHRCRPYRAILHWNRSRQGYHLHCGKPHESTSFDKIVQ